VTPDRRAKGIERVPQLVTDQVLKLVFEVVDINEILGQVDLNALLKNVDLGALLDQVDLNEVLAKIDLNALLANVDMEQLMAHTEVGAILAKSTSSVLSSILDLIRSIGVGLDDWLGRLVQRLRGKRPPRPEGPVHSVAAATTDDAASIREAGRHAVISENRQGQYAGLFSRLFAFGMDVLVFYGTYLLLAAGFGFGYELITGKTYKVGEHHIVFLILVIAWFLIYFAGQWSLSGQTLGMAAFGVRVVRTDGTTATSRQALIRTILLPVAVLIFPVSALMVILGRSRQGVHDKGAGTVVVYSWDARGARMRWLAAQPRSHVVPAPNPSSPGATGPGATNGDRAAPAGRAAALEPQVVVDGVPSDARLGTGAPATAARDGEPSP